MEPWKILMRTPLQLIIEQEVQLSSEHSVVLGKPYHLDQLLLSGKACCQLLLTVARTDNPDKANVLAESIL